MFSIIYKEMKSVGGFIIGILLLEGLLGKLGLTSESAIRGDAQAIIFVLMWFALVAYRSVEKLAVWEQSSKSV